MVSDTPDDYVTFEKCLEFLTKRFTTFLFNIQYWRSSTETRNVCTEWLFDSRPFMHNKTFLKKHIEVCSPHLYASFGAFWVQIGQLFAAQWVLKFSEEFRNRRHFPSKTANCRFSNIFQRLTVPRKIDQFWRTGCQKKRNDVSY